MGSMKEDCKKKEEGEREFFLLPFPTTYTRTFAIRQFFSPAKKKVEKLSFPPPPSLQRRRHEQSKAKCILLLLLLRKSRIISLTKTRKNLLSQLHAHASVLCRVDPAKSSFLPLPDKKRPAFSDEKVEVERISEWRGGGGEGRGKWPSHSRPMSFWSWLRVFLHKQIMEKGGGIHTYTHVHTDK